MKIKKKIALKAKFLNHDHIIIELHQTDSGFNWIARAGDVWHDQRPAEYQADSLRDCVYDLVENMRTYESMGVYGAATLLVIAKELLSEYEQGFFSHE